jgi:hypothetical protein
LCLTRWHGCPQILKEEEELNRAFGAGPKLPVPPKAAAADGEEAPKMTRILLYGNANQCEVAQRMIEEAMDNKVSALWGPMPHFACSAADADTRGMPGA